MPEFIKVVRITDLPPGTATCVEIKGLRIAFYNIDGKFYATQDYCTHADASLSEGAIDGYEIICPWHGARFDVSTGQATCGPAYDNLATYPVRVAEGYIEVEI